MTMSCLYLQVPKVGYQPLTVAVTPPVPPGPTFEHPAREAPLRDLSTLPEPRICEPLNTQPHPPALMVLPRAPAAEFSHQTVNFSGTSGSSVTIGVPPGTKFEMSAPVPSTTSPHVTDLSPSGVDIRPVSIAVTSPTAASPAVVSAVTSVEQTTSFRSPVSATATATVPVVRRRTADKSHLLISVGEWTYSNLVQSRNSSLRIMSYVKSVDAEHEAVRRITLVDGVGGVYRMFVFFCMFVRSIIQTQ